MFRPGSLVKKTIIAIFALFTFASFGNEKTFIAQDPDPSAWEIEKENLLSPATTSPAAWVLAGGAVFSYAYYLHDKQRENIGFEPDHRNGAGWMEVGEVLGWGVLPAAYLAIRWPAVKENDAKALQDSEMMFKSTIYTALITGLIKVGTRTERKNLEGKYDSFPSGHASNAFNFATNIALRHDWKWSLAAAPLAMLVALSRMEADEHYVHDTVFGAALGTSVALGMNTMAQKKNLPCLLGYSPKENGGGLYLKYQF